MADDLGAEPTVGGQEDRAAASASASSKTASSTTATTTTTISSTVGRSASVVAAHMGLSTKRTPVRANSANSAVAMGITNAITKPRRGSDSKPTVDSIEDAAASQEPAATGFLANLETQWTRRKSQWLAQLRAGDADADDEHAGANVAANATPNGSDASNVKCHVCNVPLRLLRRRHQCRNCSLPVCSVHSQNQMPLPHLGIMREARVCDICVHELVQRRAGVRQPPKRRTRSVSSQSDTAVESPPSSPPHRPQMFQPTSQQDAVLPSSSAAQDPSPSPRNAAMNGVLYSCLLEEQANIVDEILYLGTFRMGGRALASRHMNANVAIWKDRWCMLTSAELLTFKASTPNNEADATSSVVALGELRSSVHLTDILHIQVNEQYPRILSVMRSDGRVFRVRTKTPEQCQELATTLTKAQQEFQHVMDRLHRGGSIDEFSINCVTIQHESSLPEWVIASAPRLRESLHVDMYPSSILRLYVNGPEGSGIAQYSSQMILSCDPSLARENLITTEADPPHAAAGAEEARLLRVSLTRQSVSSGARKNRIVWTILVALGATATMFHRQHQLSYAAWVALLMLIIFVTAFHDPLLLLLTTKRVHFSKRFCVQCVEISYGDQRDSDDGEDEEEIVAAIPDDELDVRFVEGCKGDLREARERIVDTMRWRKKERMDGILTRPLPQFGIMKGCYTHFAHKRDRRGHIVTFGHLGCMKKMREDFLAKGVSEDDSIRYHMFTQEYLWEVVDPRPYPEGLLLAVFDMKGISMGDIGGDVFGYMRRLGETIGDYYPERLYHTFIINPPAWFSLIWKLVSPSVNPKTRERVHVIRGQKEITKELLEYIDEKNLPVEYGGKCECPGGCATNSPEEIAMRDYVENHLNTMEEGDPRIPEALAALKEKYRQQLESFDQTHLAI